MQIDSIFPEYGKMESHTHQVPFLSDKKRIFGLPLAKAPPNWTTED